ncbi:pyridoxal phosphate-dependent transferase [Xylariales sp. PMI_506]|nr:pyridoxal phosphate-dependent transferase [Xylariales sp. PMI_506]
MPIEAFIDLHKGYGPNEGHLPLRENIAALLTDFYKPSEPVTSSRICITGGASQNLACLLQVFTDPVITRKIWIAEPGYFLAFQVFHDAGFSDRLRGIPEDTCGIDVEILEKELEKSLEAHGSASTSVSKRLTNPNSVKGNLEHRKFYKHVFYCVPTFANPSGVTMSLSRRRALLSLARKHDALIICDDVYDFLLWVDAPSWECSMPRLVDLDRETPGAAADGFGNVVSNATFSKLIGPGCRVGWAEGTDKLITGLSLSVRGSTQSGGAPSQLTSLIVNKLFENNDLVKHIKEILIPTFAKRHDVMVRAIEDLLVPLGVQFNTDRGSLQGGFCIWLQLPTPLTAKEVAKAAKDDRNLSIGIGPLFAVPGKNASSLRNRLRKVLRGFKM